MDDTSGTSWNSTSASWERPSGLAGAIHLADWWPSTTGRWSGRSEEAEPSSRVIEKSANRGPQPPARSWIREA
jgi:hypothetical protein